MGQLTWMNPMLGGAALAAIALPIVIHLLARLRGRDVELPTARFVERARADVNRLERPRDWPLMLLRGLMVLAVAAAFARPVWHDVPPITTASLDKEARARPTIVMLDASASMRRHEGGVTLFDRAKAIARDQIAAADPAEVVVNVVVVGRTPRAIVPEATGNLDLLRDSLERAQATDEAADFGAAFALANDVAQRAGGLALVRVISDMQGDLPQTAGLSHIAAVEEHPVGASKLNVALSHAAVLPTSPVVGRSVTATARLTAFGTPYRGRVIAHVDGTRIAQRDVDLEADASMTVALPLTLSREGEYEVTLSLDPQVDTMPTDDVAGRFVTAVSSPHVWLVTDANADDPATAAYHVLRALSPRGAEREGFDVLRVRSADVSVLWRDGDPARLPAAIVVVDADGMPLRARRAIADHAQAGGGVWWFADDAASIEACAATLRLAGATMVDAPRSDDTARPTSSHLAAPDDDIEPFTALSPAARASIGDVFCDVPTPTRMPDNADVWLTTKDGTPVLAAARTGQGRIAVFSGSLLPAVSDFPRHPMFVPVLHEVLHTLKPGRPPEPPTFAGEAFTLNVPTGTTAAAQLLRLTLPDGSSRDIASDDAGRVTVTDSRDSGTYVMRDAASGERLTGRFVSVDSRESDPRTFAANSLQAFVGEGGSDGEASRIAGTDARVLSDHALELWPWIVAAALALSAVEGAWLLVTQRRDDDRDRERLHSTDVAAQSGGAR